MDANSFILKRHDTALVVLVVSARYNRGAEQANILVLLAVDLGYPEPR
ncbi:MAG: hypothetical protein QNL33_15765 [Akkermansiaceae bacterium]|jgi:hypothetical protein